MNIQDLDEFLHIDTSGEKWHLKHPGQEAMSVDYRSDNL